MKYVRAVLIAAFIIVAIFLIYASAPNLIMRYKGLGEKNELSVYEKQVNKIQEEKEAPKNLIKEMKEKYQNDDIFAFLSFENLNINYPIVKAKDNEFYLNHGYNKKYNINGAIFMDAENKNFYESNVILYGHRMAVGTMFNGLDKIYEYPESNFKIVTEDGVTEYEVVSAFNADAEYPYRRTQFRAGDDFTDFKKELIKRSLLKKDVNIEGKGNIVILSTCTKDSNSSNERRFIVVGREVFNKN